MTLLMRRQKYKETRMPRDLQKLVREKFDADNAEWLIQNFSRVIGPYDFSECSLRAFLRDCKNALELK